jgi:decaprenyl-phosphate phosphoribosyltransferase
MGLILACRPGQWPKNVLVILAPVAAGVLVDRGVILATAVAFASFCLASSAGYLVNDAADLALDREHPVKRSRPIASGAVAPRVAWALAAVLAVTSVVIAIPIEGGLLAVVVLVYLATTISYSLALKHVAVVELGMVAAGFLLRAIAGGVAAGVHLSTWFLVVTGFGALFIVTCKRLAEIRDATAPAESRRPVLREYTEPFLGHVMTLAAAVTVTTYCLWAFERAAEQAREWPYLLSVAPLVLAMLRYALLVERGAGAAPEEILLRDRVMLALFGAWAALFLIGVP